MTTEDKTTHWPAARGFTTLDCELVETLWDDARTARLSDLYYGTQIRNLTRWSFAIDLMIAITTSGSGVAGWAVWQDKIGGTAWACIAALAAIFAVAKPLRALDRQIRNATRQQQLYRGLLSNLENLAFDIQQSDWLTAEHRRRFQRARELLRQAGDSDDPAPAPGRLEALQVRVNTEMPSQSLWVPLPASELHPG